MSVSAEIAVKRVYDARSASDGARILVDRVWPRGLTKTAADLDEWCKDVAPSTDLRQWYGHAPVKFAEFRDRYLAELDDPARHRALDHLRDVVGQRHVTLLTATRDVDVSHAAVIAEKLSHR